MPESFSGPIFTTAQVVFTTARVTSIFVSSTAVHIYDFHIFTVIYSPLHGFIWNQLNNQRSTNWANKPTGNHFKGFTGLFGAILNTDSWIVSSVGRALHRNRKGHGFKSRTSNCEDRFHIRFFNRSSHMILKSFYNLLAELVSLSLKIHPRELWFFPLHGDTGCYENEYRNDSV